MRKMIRPHTVSIGKRVYALSSRRAVVRFANECGLHCAANGQRSATQADVSQWISPRWWGLFTATFKSSYNKACAKLHVRYQAECGERPTKFVPEQPLPANFNLPGVR